MFWWFQVKERLSKNVPNTEREELRGKTDSWRHLRGTSTKLSSLVSWANKFPYLPKPVWAYATCNWDRGSQSQPIFTSIILKDEHIQALGPTAARLSWFPKTLKPLLQNQEDHHNKQSPPKYQQNRKFIRPYNAAII